MIAHSEAGLDDLGDPLRRPQLGAVALRHRSLEQQLEQVSALLIAQFTRPTRRLAHSEPLAASLPTRVPPSHHRARVTTDPLGYLMQRAPLVEQLHRSTSTSLQLLRRASGSCHDRHPPQTECPSMYCVTYTDVHNDGGLYGAGEGLGFGTARNRQPRGRTTADEPTS